MDIVAVIHIIAALSSSCIVPLQFDKIDSNEEAIKQ